MEQEKLNQEILILRKDEAIKFAFLEKMTSPIQKNYTLISNFISLASVQGVNYLLPLITIPYLFRVLGVEKYGLFIFGFSLCQYLIIFTDFGFSLSATKYISVNREDTKKTNEYLNSVLLASFLLVGLSFLFLVSLTTYVDKLSADMGFYLSFFGIVVGNALFPSWFFQGIEKMKYISIINILTKIISITPIFIIVKSPEDYFWLPILYSIGYIAAGLISLYIVFSKIGMRFFIPEYGKIYWALKDSSSFFLSRASLSIYTISNAFILGLITNNTIVGYYGAAEKIYGAINALYAPLNGVIYPHMAKRKDISFFKRIFKLSLIINIALAISIYFLSPFIIEVLLGTKELYSVNVLRIFTIACLITVPSIMIGFPLLATFGYQRYANGSVVLGSVFHIISLVFLYLTNQINLYSAAWLVVCTEAIVLMVRLYGVKKYNLLK